MGSWTFINSRTAVLTVVAVTSLVSCAPPRDILPEWSGVFVEVDDRGPTDRGCIVDAEERTVTEWWYGDGGMVHRAPHRIEAFALLDHYSENYGTRRPTWIYRYDLAQGGVFSLHEYFDGRIVAHMTRGSDGAGSAVPLSPVAEIPALLRLEQSIIPGDFRGMQALLGRYAYLTGPVRAAERSFRAGYGSNTTIFGDTYLDTAELPPETVDQWEIFPVLQSQIMPEREAAQVEPFEAGAEIHQFARLVDIRQDPSRGDNAIVFLFRYGEPFF